MATKKFEKIKNKRKKANMSRNNQSVEGDHQEQECNIRVDQNAGEGIENALREYMQMRVLETVHEEDEKSWSNSPDVAHDSGIPAHDQSLNKSSTEQTAPFKQLLQSTPNRLVPIRNFQKLSKTTTTENVSEFIRDFAKSTCASVSAALTSLASNKARHKNLGIIYFLLMKFT